MVGLAPRERVQHRTAEQIEDIPQFRDQTVGAVTLAPRERVQQRTAEVPVEFLRLVFQERQLTENFPRSASRSLERTQIVDEPVPQILRDFAQEHILERTQIVDVPVRQILVELVSQERVQQRTTEQIEDAPQFLNETVEMARLV